jgi:beta-carotene hydroxylase
MSVGFGYTTPECVKGESNVMVEAKTVPINKVPRKLLTPEEGWLNLNLQMFCASVLLAIVAAVGYFAMHWPAWVSFLLNILSLHMVGTVIHDACHGAAHSDRRMNAFLGHGSAFLLCFSFPVFTRVHQQHHAHVNDPKNDPDHIVSTWGPLWIINARFIYHEIFFFQRRLWKRNELWEWAIARAMTVGVILLGLQFGFADYIFNCWLPPLAIVGLFLGLTFDYLPHRPFNERDRWLNARVYPSKLLNILLGGQNYHLVHHLWPAIPWYKYEAAYYEMKPLLDAKGSPQRLGILDSKQDLWGFIYDLFIGIRMGHDETEAEPIAETFLEPVKESVVTPLVAKHADPQQQRKAS